MINENWNCYNHNSIDINQCLLIHYLNTIRSQHEILATKAISSLLNLRNHLTNYNFMNIPWYSLLIWSHEQENNYNIHNEKDIKTNENYEMFTIDWNSWNLQYNIHNFRVDYLQRLKLIFFLYLWIFQQNQ
jgi:hypothetical protein